MGCGREKRGRFGAVQQRAGRACSSILIMAMEANSLAANQDSANVVVFALDPATGGLAKTGDVLEVAKPRCIKWAAAAADGAKM